MVGPSFARRAKKEGPPEPSFYQKESLKKQNALECGLPRILPGGGGADNWNLNFSSFDLNLTIYGEVAD